MNAEKFLQRIIEYSFYALFLFVPLIFTSINSELFEYNKMMLTYGLTIIVVFAWLIKMVLARKFIYRRTFLEIPLIIYLAAHVLSTIFSMDVHVSIWGYYSRFHEGLLASLSYILLYFAAVSNLKKENLSKIFVFSLVSALIVSVWGIFEHFGHSFSCLLFTGNFDVACWIQDVKNRVYASLGQPNWMAAYLDVIILGTAGIFINRGFDNLKTSLSGKNKKSFIFYAMVLILFLFGLFFTKSRSGVAGLIAGLAGFLFLVGLVKRNKNIIFPSIALCVFLAVVICFAGLPFSKLEKLTIPDILSSGKSAQATPPPPPGTDITESGDIRAIVWRGAIKVWERYPVFGSGVETFGESYYRDRPVEHNMVSEWDFLYNKAHNEYLNILATTGTVGTLAYAVLIIFVLYWFTAKILGIKILRISGNESAEEKIILSGLLAAYVSILITNFFGFSVVIIGLYFFLLPAFAVILVSPQNTGEVILPGNSRKNRPAPSASPTFLAWAAISLITLSAIFGEIKLITMWQADVEYNYAQSYEKINQFVAAYKHIKQAVDLNPNEPLFRDEMSYNNSALAYAVSQQGDATLSAELAQQAIASSDIAVSISPNNVNFWKTRTRVFYQLSLIDPQYLKYAIEAIRKAVELAPTDARVHYNYGILLDAAGQEQDAQKVLEDTVAMKPNYADAYYALGLVYEKEKNLSKAREMMEYMLSHIGKDDRATKWLSEHKD